MTKINTTEQAEIARKNIAKYFAKYILSHSHRYLKYCLYTILDVTYELMILEAILETFCIEHFFIEG